MKKFSKRIYYRDSNFDIYAVDGEYYDQAEICLAELVKGDVYGCSVMVRFRASNKDESVKCESKKVRIFFFDVIKVDFIFDKQYKDKQIRLSDKYKLLDSG